MKLIFYIFSTLTIFFILSSCKSKNINYIEYYNRSYEIDSLLNANKNEKLAIKNYKNLFREYPPVNRNAFESYIKLAEKNNTNFGKQKSLYTLIKIMAADWKREKMDTSLMKIYQKYGIDSSDIEKKIIDWRKGLNKQLIDSFSIAFNRKENVFRIENLESRVKKIKVVDQQNEQLLNWTFANFGYPSLQKIGLWGNEDTCMPIGLLMYHNSTMPENIDYYSKELLKYVISGDMPPEDYAAFIDNYRYHKKIGTKYGQIAHVDERNDMLINFEKMNKIRKSIGLKPYDKAQFEINSRP